MNSTLGSVVPLAMFYLPHTRGSQIERYDLIVLHSWTFLAVTLADAKVVKHMESVMLKE